MEPIKGVRYFREPEKRFLENGMPREVLNKITGGGASVC